MKHFSFFSSLVALLLAGCTTTLHFDGRKVSSIVLPLHEEFTIDIHGNPTTGFVWRQIHNEEAAELLESLGDSYQTDKTKGNTCGAPGMFHFTFRTKAKGKCLLQFEYIRPWEKGDAIADKKEIVITVK